jgi:Ser/Thr protein kinase RdoA (MazF antagonist)
MNIKASEDIVSIAGRFTSTGAVAGVEPFGSGNINDTFLVTPVSGNERRFVLQRLNTRVFRNPESVMRNMRAVTEHIAARLKDDSLKTDRRLETPCLLAAEDGLDWFVDARGSFWRAISFIESAETSDTIQGAGHAEEVGFALGMFHRLVGDLPPETLADTLEGFHITPRYLLHYDDIISRIRYKRSPETDYCVRFIEKRRALASVLEDAKAHGKISVRTMHGDPKINNVLIDASTRQAVGMIDLDTVKPGLAHYDIGDCLRSACNPLGEEAGQWEAVVFDTDLCRAILRGYLGQARGFLSAADYDYLFDSARLIAFELGLRFFTDHLEGNVYFRAKFEGRNLLRALCQFRLVESIEAQEAAICAIIEEFR